MLLTDDLLLDYKRCQRRTFLNIYGDRAHQEPPRDFLLKLREENQQQIQEILAEKAYVQPQFEKRNWQDGGQQTRILMAEGVELIYRGILFIEGDRKEIQDVEEMNKRSLHPSSFDYLGKPTFLIKHPGHSIWGNWFYIPVNVKLGKRAKPEYKTIAAFHGYLLTRIQGILPPHAKLLLRGKNPYYVDLEIGIPSMLKVLQNCTQMLLDRDEPEVFISRQRCSLCHWSNYCHAIARDQNHLSLVPGVTPSRYEALQSLNVNTLEALATLNLPIDAKLIEPEIVDQLQQQARSLLENRPFLRPIGDRQSYNTFPTAPVELYFDLEAQPDRNVDYLFGVLCVNHQNKTEKFYGFLAEQPEEEGFVWQQFLSLVARYPHAPIFHFSEYEVETVKRLTKLYKNTPFPLKDILSRFVDIHHWVTTTATLPVESYSLKSLANWLGFTWRDSDVAGDRVVCLYDNWLKCGDRSALETILRYNEDDCRATYHLKTWFEQFWCNSSSS
ncbi:MULTISPECIES: TM0106 family RecB-like putative nuclease [Spirulina sp. CCY15215]|uniref:TM0106 family RecB-like putative nuclease n=1 Tax=Spirulina sp. CCY15215 TaxID=2767591 RepID=UPI00194E5FBA|nr:TM0106 family RecB-like putative nuclease [Spirulina major]